MRFLGIDLGKKSSAICILNTNLDIEKISKIRNADIIRIAKRYKPSDIIIAIDSPLSFPTFGYLRDCDLELIKFGIPCISPIILKDIVLEAIRIKNELKNYKIIEVYPYATRKILNLCPDINKKREKSKLIKCIKSKLKLRIPKKIINHDEIDALLASYTAYLCYNDKCVPVGKESVIYIPKIS